MTGRFRFSLIFFLFLFLLVVFRLFYWQIVKAEELSDLGRSQYGQTVTIEPERGKIKTSDDFPIAANKISYLVFANPKDIKDKKITAKELAGVLKVDEASASASLALDKVWVPIAQRIDTDTKERLEKLNIQGIGFQRQYSRFYPEASMAAQLIGFVGKDDQGKDKGYFGIEGFYDRLLRGKEGIAIQVHDAFGKPILSQVNSRSTQIDGSSLLLSVNRSIQFIAEEKLKEGIERYGADSGMVGIMDPKTGNILAMASFPSFDPRSYQDYSADLYKNPFISNRFEPGSTFKPLVMSSAFDSNVITPTTKCPICGGPFQVYNYQIKTWNNKYYKDTNMIEVIQHSDNTGMVFVSQKLGISRMLKYLESFGIGDLTGIDLQGEVSPSLKPENQWYPVDVATASFGQGISVTAMELLDAIGAIANGGKRMEPHVVSAVETPDGDVVRVKPKVLGSPVDSKTAKIMTEIMVNAV